MHFMEEELSPSTSLKHTTGQKSVFLILYSQIPLK